MLPCINRFRFLYHTEHRLINFVGARRFSQACHIQLKSPNDIHNMMSINNYWIGRDVHLFGPFSNCCAFKTWMGKYLRVVNRKTVLQCLLALEIVAYMFAMIYCYWQHLRSPIPCIRFVRQQQNCDYIASSGIVQSNQLIRMDDFLVQFSYW